MNHKTAHVASLDADRVAMLLGWGLLPPTSRSALAVLELLCDAPGRAAARRSGGIPADLLSSAVSAVPGPLSFQSLMAPGPEELRELGDGSLLDAAIRPQTGRPLLERLAEYGRLLCDERLLPPAQLTGVVVHAFAVAALRLRHGKPVGPSEIETIASVLRAVAGSDLFPESLRSHADRCAADLEKRRAGDADRCDR